MLKILQKGLSYAPTPSKPLEEIHTELHRRFDEYAKSLRCTPSSSNPIYNQEHHQYTNNYTCNTEYIYRRMKFIPKAQTS